MDSPSCYSITFQCNSGKNFETSAQPIVYIFLIFQGGVGCKKTTFDHCKFGSSRLTQDTSLYTDQKVSIYPSACYSMTF